MPKSLINPPRSKTAEQALNSLMRLCAKAEKSSGDAMRLMYKWQVCDEDKAKVLAKLIDSRFIDDERYAAAFVREKTNLNGWGAYKLRAGLKAKGIANDIINAAVDGLEGDAMQQKLEQLLKKKSRSLLSSSPSDTYIVKAKIIRYGLSLGYDYQMVKSVSDKLYENL